MKKHSVTISGHRTSISLEDEFWTGLKEIADHRNKALADIIRQIDKDRGNHNLSSAIRIAVLDHYKSRIPTTDQGKDIDLHRSIRAE
ncbi:aryl-sulfate sulfotransferase [Cohaesibacter sp. CAU 1516]|uniref:ribbon-helix-helix domain-containing protein n=1 Tax=Cohaesibacter sp. CAU 1516 TaxID=2576038 RepID=UPI0010FE3500|nr:ribbon-helix-helix domain-containing protein [Cohaesibacter sp. CAU 1516]TLP48458.1 aryl-sulfate sulfotransferase [Cohaesibacter sp. CAU 1516]